MLTKREMKEMAKRFVLAYIQDLKAKDFCDEPEVIGDPEDFDEDKMNKVLRRLEKEVSKL